MTCVNKSRLVYVAIVIFFLLTASSSIAQSFKVREFSRHPNSAHGLLKARNVSVTYTTSQPTRYDFDTCPFFMDRLKCYDDHEYKGALDGKLEYVLESGALQVLERTDLERWPFPNNTVWFFCDSLCFHLVISLACQLQKITYPQKSAISNDYPLTRDRYCVDFVGGGRLCHFYQGCFSGKCFLPGCPVRPEFRNCLEEVTQLVHPRDVLFTGLTTHLPDDHKREVTSELNLFKQTFVNDFLKRQVRVVWMTTSAQHFRTASGRLTAKQVEKKVHGSHACVPHKRNGEGTTNILSRHLIEELNLTIFPFYDLTAEAYVHYHGPHCIKRCVDCTHYCHPGVTDVSADYISLLLKNLH